MENPFRDWSLYDPKEKLVFSISITIVTLIALIVIAIHIAIIVAIIRVL